MTSASRTSRLTKPQRQHRIQRLLEDNAVSTQERLVELLAADGVVATQATVSRDLEDLGAIKVRVPGGETVYAVPAMPKDAVAPEEHLRRVCSEWVVEVSHSHNLVVLRTPPGAAQFLASAFDKADLGDVLGTIAGDDTVLVISRDPSGGDTLARRFLEFANHQTAKDDQ